ncbi:MAG: hypothetical protein NVSMB7_01040 [Chitinophagaceae bacterium]
MWLSNHTRKIDIDSLKAWGFNSVRLPMHYNLYTLPIESEPVAGQQTWLDKGFALTDSLLAWCKANKMWLILDLHAAPGGQGNDLNIADRDPATPSLWENEANRQKTIALWKKLAARYANEPFIGGYDIINEPNWGFQDTANDKHGLKEKSNAPLRKLMMAIEKNNIGWSWWPLKKLGANNPLQIRSNHNYEALLAYWNGKRENPPRESDVYSGLLELATYTRFETNIRHRDVVDAMMRQPFSSAAKPFKANSITDGSVLNAVDYDVGVNGVAYYDTDTADYHISTQQRTAGNRGRVYRNDGVDIHKDSAMYESYYVSDIEDGEWLQFTINVKQKETYNLELLTASSTDSGKIMIRDGNTVLAENIAVPNRVI